MPKRIRDEVNEENKEVTYRKNNIYFHGDVNIENGASLTKHVLTIQDQYKHNILWYKYKKSRISKKNKLKLQLHELEKPSRWINIYINSDGGDTHVGFQLYHFLKKQKYIHTINEAFCSSSATFVFLAGRKRSCSPFAEFAIHEVTYKLKGKLCEHQKEVERSKKIMENVKKIYLQNLKINLHDLDLLLDSDSFFDKDYAKKIGFLVKQK